MGGTSADRPYMELSARVDAAVYGQRQGNIPAFLPLEGLFLAVGRGGECATVVISDDPNCSVIANATVTDLTVKVGGAVATLNNRSADGLRITVNLPSYDAVCSAGQQCGPGTSQTISVTSTNKTLIAWSCPPDCPNRRGPSMNLSALHRENTAALREGEGGLTYVRSCASVATPALNVTPPLATEAPAPAPATSAPAPAAEASPSPAASLPQAMVVVYTITAEQREERCRKAAIGRLPFTTDPRDCLDPKRARAALCAYGEGGSCQCCPANARCPGGARAWPDQGYYVKNESSTFAYPCDPPQMKRCLGMIHGSMSDRQCGAGYEGPRCGRCAKQYYESPTSGACVSCGNMTAGDGQDNGFRLEQAVPLLWLGFGVLLGVGVVFLLVFAIQRQRGGTMTGGLFRALDFACYLIILLQTTLFIANDSVKSTSDVVFDRFKDTAEGSFIKAFFEAISIFQLDFSASVRLPCLSGGDGADFEKIYAALTCLVVVIYIAALLLLPRLRIIKNVLLFTPTRTHYKRNLLYNQFAERIGIWLILTHAVSCRIALSNLYKYEWRFCAVARTGGDNGSQGGGLGDERDCHDTEWWWVLFVIHGIGFPLSTFFGAFFVRKRLLGGTCCHDTPTTSVRQLEDMRATGELSLWKYYLGRCLRLGVRFCLCLQFLFQSIYIKVSLSLSHTYPPPQITTTRHASTGFAPPTCSSMSPSLGAKRRYAQRTLQRRKKSVRMTF